MTNLDSKIEEYYERITRTSGMDNLIANDLYALAVAIREDLHQMSKKLPDKDLNQLLEELNYTKSKKNKI